MNCPKPSHWYDVIVAVGVAAHSITLYVDYWLTKAEHIESNSIVELGLKLVKKILKKKIDELDMDKMKEGDNKK